MNENATKQERFARTEVNSNLRKNESCVTSGLGGRSVVVFRQAGRQAGSCSLQNFKNPTTSNSTTFSGCLKGFMVLMTSYYGRYLKEVSL